MEQNKIWSHFQNEGAEGFAGASGRYEMLVKTVLKTTRLSKGSALNIGIGGGGVDLGLLDAGWSVCSLDPDERAVQRLSSLGVDAKVGKAQSMPFPDGVFDAVVISEVLEHIPASERPYVYREIWRVLKTKGILVGTVPYREKLLDNDVVCPSCGTLFHRWGHITSFDREALSGELIAHRFLSITCHSRTFPEWRQVNSPRSFLKALAKWLLGRLGEGIVHPSLFFVAKK